MGNATSSSSSSLPSSNKLLTVDGTVFKLNWSFLDQTGLHQIVLYHDVFSGVKRILHNGFEILRTNLVLLDEGGIYQFQFPERRINGDVVTRSSQMAPVKVVVEIKVRGLDFLYDMLVNNVPIADYNRKNWKSTLFWCFLIDGVPYLVAVIKDPFVLFINGYPYHYSEVDELSAYRSEFTSFGSSHSLFLPSSSTSSEMKSQGCLVVLHHYVASNPTPQVVSFASQEQLSPKFAVQSIYDQKCDADTSFQLLVNGLLIPSQCPETEKFHLAFGTDLNYDCSAQKI